MWILGRYNRDEEGLLNDEHRHTFSKVLDVRFSTIHRLKGSEGDIVILPYMITGEFPSLRSEDPLMTLVNSPADSYGHSEERQLFYVTLTRAREQVVMFTINHRTSPFLRELASDNQVEITAWGDRDTHFPPCPDCTAAFLFRRAGPYGSFFGCDTYPVCRHTRSFDTEDNPAQGA